MSIILFLSKRPYFWVRRCHLQWKLTFKPQNARDASSGAGKGGNFSTIRGLSSSFRPRLFLRLVACSGSGKLSGWAQCHCICDCRSYFFFICSVHNVMKNKLRISDFWKRKKSVIAPNRAIDARRRDPPKRPRPYYSSAPLPALPPSA